MGTTYLYKLLPDGTPSREGDNEYPVLDSRDTALLGYAVNRLRVLTARGSCAKADFSKTKGAAGTGVSVGRSGGYATGPALAGENELPRQRFFPGVGHLVIRDGCNQTDLDRIRLRTGFCQAPAPRPKPDYDLPQEAIWRSTVARIIPTQRALTT